MSDRMIIEDPQGRVVSVPSNKIPKGSRIIRADILPGDSRAAAETNVSKPAEDAPSAPPATSEDTTPDSSQDAPPEVEVTAVDSVTVEPRKKK